MMGKPALEQRKEIGLRLKRLRQMHNYTQNQLAEYLNMDQSNYSKVEHGERTIGKLSQLKRLCILYDCTQEYILYGSGDYEPFLIIGSKGINLDVIAQINTTMNCLKLLRKIEKKSGDGSIW